MLATQGFTRHVSPTRLPTTTRAPPGNADPDENRVDASLPLGVKLTGYRSLNLLVLLGIGLVLFRVLHYLYFSAKLAQALLPVRYSYYMIDSHSSLQNGRFLAISPPSLNAVPFNKVNTTYFIVSVSVLLLSDSRLASYIQMVNVIQTSVREVSLLCAVLARNPSRLTLCFRCTRALAANLPVPVSAEPVTRHNGLAKFFLSL